MEINGHLEALIEINTSVAHAGELETIEIDSMDIAVRDESCRCDCERVAMSNFYEKLIKLSTLVKLFK